VRLARARIEARPQHRDGPKLPPVYSAAIEIQDTLPEPRETAGSREGDAVQSPGLPPSSRDCCARNFGILVSDRRTENLQ